MKTRSVWQKTKTFFSLFLDQLHAPFSETGSICIVGASDGKFVLPLTERGWRVIAIEVDNTALYGGPVEFPETGQQEILGLIKRLRIEGLEQHIEIINDDFLVCRVPGPCSAVFTSCSWHYSRNRHRPILEFIERMQAIVEEGGIFCAEYMMPCEPQHEGKEHYLKEGELRKHFTRDWEVMEEFYTVPFVEEAHVGNLVDHIHRMGFFIARKVI